jgi:hypothetical protein
MKNVLDIINFSPLRLTADHGFSNSAQSVWKSAVGAVKPSLTPSSDPAALMYREIWKREADWGRYQWCSHQLKKKQEELAWRWNKSPEGWSGLRLVRFLPAHFPFFPLAS